MKENKNGGIRNNMREDDRKEGECSDKESDKKTRTPIQNSANIEGGTDHRNELMVHKWKRIGRTMEEKRPMGF